MNYQTLPFVISDSNQLVEVESISVGSLTVVAKRSGDSLWKWGDDENYFYAKDADDQSKPYMGAFNELAARYVAKDLDIKYQDVTVLNTHKGIKIGSVVDPEFPHSLEQIGMTALQLSEEEKIKSFLLQVLLADTNGNDGSILVHQSKTVISRIDFERCFGYNGTTYDPSVTVSLGNVHNGPFYTQIKKRLLQIVEKLDELPMISRVEAMNVDNFHVWGGGAIDGLSVTWPNAKDELLRALDHMYKCISYRKGNIKKLVLEKLQT